jgi:DNA modification methylase
MDKIICGDVLEELRKLPDNLVDCIVTSPPKY